MLDVDYISILLSNIYIRFEQHYFSAPNQVFRI